MHDFGDQMDGIVNLLGFISSIHPSKSPLKAFLEEGHGNVTVRSLHLHLQLQDVASLVKLATSSLSGSDKTPAGVASFLLGLLIAARSCCFRVSSPLKRHFTIHLHAHICCTHDKQTQFECASSTLTTELLNLK